MDRSPLEIWVVRLLAVAAIAAGRVIVVPGVDSQALAAMSQSGGLLALFNQGTSAAGFASLFGVAMRPLLIVSLGLVLVASNDPLIAARRQRIGALLFLGWCALNAYPQALLLESTGRGFGSTGFEPVLVDDTGLKFRALAVLTWVGAAAVLWFLAQWVTQRGAILGAVLFTGLLVCEQDVELLVRGWRSALAGEPDSFPLVRALPWVVGLAVLASSAPKQWPVRGPGGFQLRSRLEVLLLPLAAGQLVAMSWLFSITLSFGAAVAIALAMSKERERRGSPLFLVLGLVLPIPAVAIAAFPFAQRMLEARSPGPFDGQGRFEVELTCAGANAELVGHDARILEERLKRSRVAARVSAEGTTLRLSLENVGAPQELLAAITPRYRLSFQLVARDESMLLPDALDWRGAGLSLASDYAGDVIVAPTAEALAPLLAPLEIPAGFELSIECRERSGAMGCSPRLLETGAALRSETIREASVTFDQQNEPTVSLQFDSEGATQLANLTTETGRQMAIVLDGRVLSAPVIQSRIEGGRANVTLGRSGSREQRITEARRLADGLESQPLSCAWETRSVNEKK